MVDNASLRSYIVHHDQSGLSRPNYKGKNGGYSQYSQYNIYNVVNVNKAINRLGKINKAINELKEWEREWERERGGGRWGEVRERST
jgi:hypothetical protein